MGPRLMLLTAELRKQRAQQERAAEAQRQQEASPQDAVEALLLWVPEPLEQAM